MRMKRGANSMRVRRRQSDAKWRASVSSCYDTLKFVIPDSCDLPRRKFSKALILQETAKHIRTLEEAVSTLLTQEAKLLNKSVLWKTGKQWTPATLAHIRKEFEEQQGQLFEQSTQGRRRYSMLADIQEQILHMSVDPNHVTVISLGGGVEDKTSKTGNSKDKGKEVRVRRKAKILTKESTKVYEEPQAHSTPCPKKQRKHSHSVNIHDFETNENIPVICERVPNADLLPSIALRPDYKYDMSHDVPLSTPSKLCYHGNEELFSPVVECGFNTPVFMNPNPNRVDTKPQITSPRFSKVAKQLEFTSEDDQTLRPSCHHDKMSEMTSVFGFTPIKLPPEPGTVPSRLPHDQVTQATPTVQAAQGLPPAFQRNSYPPQTPKSDCLESGDEETKSLLCFETFEMVSDDDDDDGVPDWERTPDKIKHCEQTSPVEEGEKKDQCKRKIAFGKGTNRARKSRDRIPKCRKNLEKLYASPEDLDGKELPVITGVFDKDATGSDFDGYFLFYRQVAEMLQKHMSRTEIASPSVAITVSQMWNNMSSDDKETLATLAALEGSQDSNSSSGLSDDLQELDVKPLDSSHFIDASKIGIFKRNLQDVPNVPTVTEAAERVLGSVSDFQDVQEVPKSYLPSLNDCVGSLDNTSDEMAIMNLAFEDQEGLPQLGFERSENDEEFKTRIATSNDYSGSESSQIVPDITNIIKRDVLLSSSQSPTAVTAYTQR